MENITYEAFINLGIAREKSLKGADLLQETSNLKIINQTHKKVHFALNVIAFHLRKAKNAMHWVKM